MFKKVVRAWLGRVEVEREWQVWYVKFLRGLGEARVTEGWVKNIDENSIMEASNQFVTPKIKGKEADLIYKLQIKDREIYFFLLMELQSTVDYLMPYRLLSYMVELWGQVIKKAGSSALRKDFRLPAIVPLVLYNGAYNWTASRSFIDMIEHNHLFHNFLPDFRYMLIDVNRYSLQYLQNLANTTGAIFILDQKYDILDLVKRLEDASCGIKALEPLPYDAFREWFRLIVCKRLPTKVVDELLIALDQIHAGEVNRMKSNLAETISKAYDDAILKGRMLEKTARDKEIAINMLKINLPIDTIATVLGISCEELSKIRAII